MSVNVIQDILKLLADGANLPHERAVRAFQIIMNGGATPAQMGAFLMGLRMKGETVEEIAAGAEVLRVKAPKVAAPEGAIDVCGTGGDGMKTLNISTAVAFVVAACGVPVAKHGNRGISSASGSADVLAALGVNINAPVPVIERCMRELNLGFMMAPQFHAAMRHVAPVRQELELRTVFNLLGPLANPAQPPYQMVGVFARAWVVPVAQVLKTLGLKRAWVVHGSDGMDELTLSGTSYVAELVEGAIHGFEIRPEDAGLPPASAEAIRGGDATQNAKAMQELLLGMQSAYRNAVLLNAAAALIIAGKAGSLSEGVSMAADGIDSGRAYAILQKLMVMSHGSA